MGLTLLEVKEARTKFGLNIIKREKKFQILKSFFRQFADLMILLLIIAAIFAIINNELFDGYAIISIVVLNSIIGFIQEFKAEKAVEALQKLVSPLAKVIRDGNPQIINASEIVPGDIMLVETGDRIAADGVIIINNSLYVQESTLTGESTAVAKDKYQDNKQKHPTSNQQVFMGTEVTNGFATIQVLKIGANTKFGQIAKLTQQTNKVQSPLQREVKQTGLLVTKITIVLAGLLFIIGFLVRKQSLIDNLLFTASVAVAAVPEGLPTTITIALALGVQRLAKKGAIVKQLASAETLGSTSCIITDKTGTLTRNEMFAQKVITLKNSYFITGDGYKPLGEITPFKRTVKDSQNLELIELICRYCVSTSLNKKNNYYEVLGDPTEAALIVLSEKLASYNKKQSSFQVLHTQPFDSERKMMSVNIKQGKKYYLLAKGAPESILSHCKLSKTQLLTINQKYYDLSSKGLRVLALAMHERADKKESNLTFLGLIGILDPPRKEVKKAILQAKQAGIRIIVATGDNGNTAKSIASTLGIVSHEAKIYTNTDLQKLSLKDIQKILANKSDIIFARVTPEDKLKLVQAAQLNEEIVAVTGDGVNDAPALKQADIGVAMGITGTDVSKESASMILATDKFNTIIDAIAEGRKIYNNLKKIVFYLFSSNIGELIPIFFAILFSLPTPLTAILILIINVGTDALPAIALSVDNESTNLLKLPPRSKSSRILEKELLFHVISIGIFIGTITLASFISVLYSNGWHWGGYISPELKTKAVTVVFVTLICVQFFNAINASNLFGGSILKFKIWQKKFFLFSITITLPIVWLITENHYLQTIFKTTSLSPKLWSTIILLSSSILLIEELYKKIIKTNNAPY